MEPVLEPLSAVVVVSGGLELRRSIRVRLGLRRRHQDLTLTLLGYLLRRLLQNAVLLNGADSAEVLRLDLLLNTQARVVWPLGFQMQQMPAITQLLESKLLAGEIRAWCGLGQACRRSHFPFDLEVIFLRVALADLNFTKQFGTRFDASCSQVECAKSTPRAHSSIELVDGLVIGRQLLNVLSQILKAVWHALQVQTLKWVKRTRIPLVRFELLVLIDSVFYFLKLCWSKHLRFVVRLALWNSARRNIVS